MESFHGFQGKNARLTAPCIRSVHRGAVVRIKSAPDSNPVWSGDGSNTGFASAVVYEVGLAGFGGPQRMDQGVELL